MLVHNCSFCSFLFCLVLLCLRGFAVIPVPCPLLGHIGPVGDELTGKILLFISEIKVLVLCGFCGVFFVVLVFFRVVGEQR